MVMMIMMMIHQRKNIFIILNKDQVMFFIGKTIFVVGIIQNT